MNARIARLRKLSFEAQPALSIERALLETEFYQKNNGKYSLPVMRAMFFKYLCERKTLYIGEDELIVGERGPAPKVVPTFPELTCHSGEDLHILNTRSMTSYAIAEGDIATYVEKVVPYWTGRSMRDRIFSKVPDDWQRAYQSGLFTEFMEQRAPGHTALDGRIYECGMEDYKKRIDEHIARLDYLNDPEAADKYEQLKAMALACDAVVIFAERHAELAEEMTETGNDQTRREELLTIARVCRHVPRYAPRNFHEAVQMYWFVHLGTITEL
ncbi:MAG: pyruvate formate lyase family protein, partial [Desulfocapsaceae bacterium]|nr:pyruvate formate lyase family protein [Desulfocapsaceae bacterium]